MSAHDQADVDVAPAPAADARPRARAGDIAIVFVLFALLFGYDVYEGVGNLLLLPEYYALAGNAEHTPWLILVIGIAAPVVLFVAGILIGRRRGLVARAGILLVALGVSAQLQLLLESWARLWAAAVLGG